jgi:cold shock protein
MSRYKGTVKWFNNAKGYGCLGRNDGGPDVVVQFCSIQGEGYTSLREGEAVALDVVRGEKELQADQLPILKKK